MADFDRSVFNADVLSKMDDIRTNCPDIEDRDPDSKVFCYMVADAFESLDPDVFCYTDGPNDLGIDFFIRRDGSYSIYQCKSVKYETLEKGRVFDSTPVNELDEAIEYLLGGEGNPSREIESLKNAFSFGEDENSLTAVLAIEGRLSESASVRFSELKASYRRRNVSVELVDERALYSQWHSLESSGQAHSIKLQLKADKGEILKQNGWCCAVIPVRMLLDGVRKYGNALFDLNVRSNLRKSSINEAIRECVSTSKGRKQFELLNNGLVVTCTSYKFKDEGFIELSGAQVVNGCQTLSTLWNYYKSVSADERQEIDEDVRIFVKIINDTKATKDDLLDKIVVASNNQNPMNPRNLKSNSIEQRRIQKELATSPVQGIRYFYIRKDGEFEAYLDKERGTKNKPYRAKEFLIPNSSKRGVNRYRSIDNEDLAKVWWAWIGCGQSANSGSVKYFEGATYRDVFEKKPSLDLWTNLGKADGVFQQDLLEEGQVSAYQFLLALALCRYISYRVKPKEGLTRYKFNCLAKLRRERKLSSDASKQDEARALSQDVDYLKKVWMNQMTYALTEVSSYLLINVYGALNAETCKRILDFEDVHSWLACGMDPKLYVEQQEDTLLALIFDWMELSAGSVLTREKERILLSNRPKLELSKRESIRAIKRQCKGFDDGYREYPLHGKKPGASFTESFPKL